MKILSAEQIRETDKQTMLDEPVSSIDLMERAALACVKQLMRRFSSSHRFLCFCGRGNNGGDGLAIARLLVDNGFLAMAYHLDDGGRLSDDCSENAKRLREKYPSAYVVVKDATTLQAVELSNHDVIVECLLGTGFTGSPEGLVLEAIRFINACARPVISVDVPAGLSCDSYTGGETIHSTLTLTFQSPKLAFLLPDSAQAVPDFEVLDIGLSQAAIEKQPSRFYYITGDDIAGFLKPRSKFSHKGTYGHALLIAGSEGKSGAAIMAAEACLRSGAGLLTVHSTRDTLQALLQRLPEAMAECDTSATHITSAGHADRFAAAAMGPGTGTHEETAGVLKKLLHYPAVKLVLDADALNILSENKTWLSYLPHSTILTPHPGEFARLAGKSDDGFERLNQLTTFSMKHRCITILKGAHTAVAMPDGTVFFNSSGNPALAKGGSGDVLTGIILGLLARGYNAPQSALIGVYIHGLAADLAIRKQSVESVLATDIVAKLGRAFRKTEG
jgi:ADP-dependent NAD(P)H-hydrate dehydratase / NAD(P)H-hydrate epimerase